MPLVSVIVPCLNEQDTISLLLNAIYSQDFSLNNLEVIIADALSTDDTREKIIEFHASHPELELQIVENKARSIPAGLNQAIEASKGEIIIRLDAHSMPYPDYIRLCVETLNAGFGENVGGVWEIRPGGNSWQARSIAVSASHPLGVGDAKYRFAQHAQAVETVPFGAFFRSLISKVGLFNEKLLTNEDYEFNTRIRKIGGTIWLEPRIRSVYFARDTFIKLARQYFRYGFWKARMLRSYPKTIRWRQALPPIFILSLVVLLITSMWYPIARWFFLFEIMLYSFILFASGLQLAFKNRDIGLILGIPISIVVMHLCWGSGFLWSLIVGREN